MAEVNAARAAGAIGGGGGGGVDEGAKSGLCEQSTSRTGTAGEVLAKRCEPGRDCEPELLLRVSIPVVDVRETDRRWSPSDFGRVPAPPPPPPASGDECGVVEPAPMRLRTRVSIAL